MTRARGDWPHRTTDPGRPKAPHPGPLRARWVGARPEDALSGAHSAWVTEAGTRSCPPTERRSDAPPSDTPAPRCCRDPSPRPAALHPPRDRQQPGAGNWRAGGCSLRPRRPASAGAQSERAECCPQRAGRAPGREGRMQPLTWVWALWVVLVWLRARGAEISGKKVEGLSL